MIDEHMRQEARQSGRRSIIKAMFASAVAAGAGPFGVAHARPTKLAPGEIRRVPEEAGPAQEVPLFSGAVVHNGLVYVAGKGYHGEGDITKHTTEVLNQIEEELERAGSSMDRALKVNVYLHDMRDYAAMNAAYRGRFGDRPPVRTTVACYAGIPGSSLVEIDCIAALNDE
jgi:2-iminobutanoate/2-iminopropanoate deaminase